MAGQTKIIAGVAWFRSEQWELLRAFATDPEELEQTHAEWVRNAEKGLKRIVAQGITVRKVDVDVNVLAAWCAGQGRPLDRAARAAYAAEEVRKLPPDAPAR